MGNDIVNLTFLKGNSQSENSIEQVEPQMNVCNIPDENESNKTLAVSTVGRKFELFSQALEFYAIMKLHDYVLLIQYQIYWNLCQNGRNLEMPYSHV
jgi:hypothetical protein